MSTERGIDQRPNGRFRLRVMTPKGRVTKTFATLSQAVKYRDALYTELNDETLVPIEGMSLVDLRSSFLSMRKKLRDYKSDRSRFDTHLATAPFAKRALVTVRRRDVLDWRDALEGKDTAHKWGDRPIKPLSRSTRKHCLNLLRAALNFAVDREIIPTNVAKDVRVGGEADPIPDDWFLTPTEQQTIRSLETAERWIAMFAIGTGLRQAEQWSLRLVDVHVGGNDPHVMVRFGNAGKTTKSKKARLVPLFGAGLEAAKAWLAVLPSYAKENPLGLMFPTPRGARRGTSKVPAEWKTMVTAIGRHVHWHLLRHTAASSLVAGWWGRQWTLEEVKVFMGHSSITVTERYAHLARTRLHAVATEAHASWSRRGPELQKAAEFEDRGGLRSRKSSVRIGSGVQADFVVFRDHARTTILAALSAVEKGEPTALRQAVDALSVALDLIDATVESEATDGARGAS